MSKRTRNEDGSDVLDSVRPEPLPTEPDFLPEPEPKPAAAAASEDDAEARERKRLSNPESDRDRLDALRAWGSALRFRGIVTSGDWEEFARLAGEGAPGTPAVR